MNYDTLASTEAITKTIAALKEHRIEAEIVTSKEEALERIKALVPQGASVMNGSSRTLEEIGYIEYLKSGAHGWKNLHEAILAEKDEAKQSELRNQALFSDYYLGSVHAVTEDGEMIIASASGSQLPHLVFTSKNLVLVAGAQKIVPDQATALMRVRDYVFPRDDDRMKSVGYPGSLLAKILIFANEHPMMGRKVHLILVNEQLGF